MSKNFQTIELQLLYQLTYEKVVFAEYSNTTFSFQTTKAELKPYLPGSDKLTVLMLLIIKNPDNINW